jgi:hypothetical protein
LDLGHVSDERLVAFILCQRIPSTQHIQGAEGLEPCRGLGKPIAGKLQTPTNRSIEPVAPVIESLLEFAGSFQRTTKRTAIGEIIQPGATHL